MNNEIKSIDAEQANSAIANANRLFALELKRKEVTQEAMRNVETNNFE